MTESPRPSEGLSTTSIHERREILLETTRELLEQHDLQGLRLILNNQHAADLAELMRQLDEGQQSQVLKSLADALAADVLAEMDPQAALSIAEEMGHEELSDLVEEMEPDDAADLLGDLPEADSNRVLELMEEEEAAQVRELLTHDEDTGGGIMTSRLIALRPEMTVADAVARLRTWAEQDHEEVHYLYVVDEAGRLTGSVSLRKLILARGNARIGDLAEQNPITVRTDTDQEEVARLFSEYDLLAVPVVDDEGKLVGRVTIDDVVEVIHQEATEDIYVMAATSSEELEARSVAGVVRRRLPWLLVCVVGTFISGSVINLFQNTIASLKGLLIFVPAIMAMGGNTGLQATTVTVRGLATGQLHSGELLGAAFRELRIGLVLGVILGVLFLGVSQVWTGTPLIGICVGSAMVVAVVFSVVLGVLIPVLFRALGVDPAVASGPLITTLNDGLSLGLYFTIAAQLLRHLG
jgi:magnesium transporter